MKLLPLCLALLLCSGSLQAEPSERVWTSSEGATFEGTLEEATEDSAVIRRSADGRTFSLSLDRLSEADQAYIKSYLSEQDRMSADRERLKGFEEGPYADILQDEWVKFPKDKHGLVFQVKGLKDLRRSDELVPLFIYLHGAGGRAEDVETGKVESIGQEAGKENQLEDTPWLVVAPLCPTESSWGKHVKELEAIIDDLVGNLPIDRNRIYLSGYSMGSRGACSLLLSRPKFYAATLLADGEVKPEWAKTVDTALWMWFSGERNMDGAQKTADAFEAEGKVVHLELFPDLLHNQLGYKMSRDEEVFEWTYEQRLNSPAQK